MSQTRSFFFGNSLRLSQAIFGLLLSVALGFIGTPLFADEEAKPIECFSKGATPAPCVIRKEASTGITVQHDGAIHFYRLPADLAREEDADYTFYGVNDPPPTLEFPNGFEIEARPVDLAFLAQAEKGKYDGHDKPADLQIVSSGFADILRHGQGKGFSLLGQLSGWWKSDYASLTMFLSHPDEVETYEYRDYVNVDALKKKHCFEYRLLPGLHGATRVGLGTPTYKCEYLQNQAQGLCYANFFMNSIQDCRQQEGDKSILALTLFRGIGKGRGMTLANIQIDFADVHSGDLIVIHQPNKIFIAMKKR